MLVRHHVLGDVLLRHVLGARLSVLIVVVVPSLGGYLKFFF